MCREPLPKESELWRHEKVKVTPHVSGISFAEDVVKIFVDNLERYVQGKELKYVVDLNKGY